MKGKRALGVAVLGLTLAALVGCKTNVTPIKTLLDDPARFDKTTVRIAGDVEDAASVMGYGAYRVNDGTGTIAVVTTTNGAPRAGAKVGVEGEFRSAFTLGSTTGSVLMEKQRFTP
jgi:hypothetical protein